MRITHSEARITPNFYFCIVSVNKIVFLGKTYFFMQILVSNFVWVFLIIASTANSAQNDTALSDISQKPFERQSSLLYYWKSGSRYEKLGEEIMAVEKTKFCVSDTFRFCPFLRRTLSPSAKFCVTIKITKWGFSAAKHQLTRAVSQFSKKKCPTKN